MKKFSKNLIVSILMLTLLFTLCINVNSNVYAATVNGFDYKAGDIVITSSTLSGSSSLSGHAGIVLPDGKNILHIAGIGYTPTVISISDWLTNYPSTKVVRCNDSSIAENAANWTESYYVNGDGQNASYAITPDIYGLSPTYCSKIVWQAYYYGADFEYDINTAGIYYCPVFIAPYDFINTDNQEYNGFTTVASINW